MELEEERYNGVSLLDDEVKNETRLPDASASPASRRMPSLAATAMANIGPGGTDSG